jgi:hypothetical protein
MTRIVAYLRTRGIISASTLLVVLALIAYSVSALGLLGYLHPVTHVVATTQSGILPLSESAPGGADPQQLPPLRSNVSRTATDTSSPESDTFLLGLIGAGTALLLGGIFYSASPRSAFWVLISSWPRSMPRPRLRSPKSCRQRPSLNLDRISPWSLPRPLA